MPIFEYSGQLRGGQAVSGTMEAAAIEDARGQLAAMGIQVATLAAAERMRVGRALSREDILFFNQQLASLASSGIALDQGLRIIAQDLKRGRLRRVIDELAGELERGVPLERAVQARASAFPPLYAEILKAGVRNNQLGATLCSINTHLSLATAGRRLFWESAMYPLIVLLLGGLLLSFFMTAVVPQLKDISKSFQQCEYWDWSTNSRVTFEPPMVTRAILWLSDNWNLVLVASGIAAAALVAALMSLRMSPAGRRWRESMILGTPGVAPIYRASLLARFAQGGALAAAAGQDLPALLRLAAGSTGSEALMQDAEQLSRRVETGAGLDPGDAHLRIIPAIASYTIKTAGHRGQLAAALADMAQNYDALARHRLAMLRMFLTPILIVLTAAILGTGILAMFSPLRGFLYGLTGS